MSVFSGKEFGLLVAGVSDLDVTEWRENSRLSGYDQLSPVRFALM